jgi:hypothetical protein
MLLLISPQLIIDIINKKKHNLNYSKYFEKIFFKSEKLNLVAWIYLVISSY